MIKSSYYSRRFHCAYLYPDGHAVIVYEKHDNDAGEVQFVEIHERFFTHAKFLHFKGRIVCSKLGLVNLMQDAVAIEATGPRIEDGTQKTIAMGIPVSTLNVQTKGGTLHFYDLHGLWSGDFTYQPGDTYAETFRPDILATTSVWGTHHIARVVPAKAVTVSV
jgi:hypothetical protein